MGLDFYRKAMELHIVDPDERGAQLARWSVSSEGFGKFMCDILFADSTENYAKVAREVAAKTANPAKTANL